MVESMRGAGSVHLRCRQAVRPVAGVMALCTVYRAATTEKLTHVTVLAVSWIRLDRYNVHMHLFHSHSQCGHNARVY